MKPFTLLLRPCTWLCLGLLLALPARAALTYWDPQGMTGGNPYLGDLSGAWEDAAWSTANTGQASPQPWVEGTAALFGIHTGLGTPAFTVTMNADHSVAGIFNGITVNNACDVTINGTGTMTLPVGNNGLQGFNAANSSDGSLGCIRLNVPLTGPAAVVAEGNGQLFFHGTNSYIGGTYLGYGSAVWNGTWNFSNSYAFSTGPILITRSGGTLALEGTAPVTITNAVISTNTPATNALNLAGNPAGLTFSGPWTLGVPTRIGSAGPGNLVLLSGPISGAGALSKFNAGTLVLSGVNSYTGPTTNAAGTLSLSADNNLGAPPLSERPYSLVLSNGAALNATASFFLHQNRGLALFGNAFLGADGGQTLTVAGTIAGACGLTITNRGTLVLAGANTYTGPTTNWAGTLSLSADDSLGTVPDSTNINALVLGSRAMLNANASFTLEPNRGLLLLGDAFLGADAGQTLAYGGTICGAFGLTITNAGTVLLTGTNRYTGPTTVGQGTLALGAVAPLGVSPVTVCAGATLANATTAPVVLSGSTRLGPGAFAAFTAVGGAASTVGPIRVLGDLTLNTNVFTLNVSGAALVPGTYRLMECTGRLSGFAASAPLISGIPLSSGYTASVTSAAGPGGHLDLIIKATPIFTGLTLSPAVTYGATNLTLSGTLRTADPYYPAPGEVISVTINGRAQSTTLNDAVGDFTLTYNPAALCVSNSPYTIIYAYAGNALLNAAADTSTALTVNPAPLTVTANNATRAYGEPNPAFTDTLVGVVNGDAITAINTCSATPTSAPGQYAIVPSLLDPNHRLGNYAVTANHGTLTVTCPTISLCPATPTLPIGLVGAAYNQTLSASGGAGSYSFALTAGSLPAGLSLAEDGVLSGTLSAEGTNVFTLTATDTNGCPGSRSYTLAVVVGQFVPLKGTYTGLFYETNVVAPASAGSFTLTTATNRHFTGSLQLAGVRYSLRGLFETDGTARVFIPAHKPNALQVVLQVDLVPGSDRLSGTVSDGTWTAVLVGHRAVFDGKAHVAPQAGAYTVVIPGNAESAAEPYGHGYGTVSVDKAGHVRWAGTLADGTKVSQTAVVSQDGQWPLYLSLYGRRGLLLGWLNFTNDVAAALDLESTLNWLRPAGAGVYYQSGFMAQAPAVGARWVAPRNGTNVLALSSGSLVLSGAGLGQALTNTFAFGPQRKVLDLSGNTLRLSFTASSGAFSGSVLEPVSGKRLPFGGVVLQSLNSGYGCFLGTNQSGQVYLGQ